VEKKIFQTRTKWAKFTYTGQQTRLFTKLHKNSRLKITYESGNKIEKLLSVKNGSVNDNFNKSSVYQLTCPDCDIKYIGQMGIIFFS